MEIRLHDDPEAFGRIALPLLQADPVRHTFTLTLLAARLRGGAPNDLATMLTIHDGADLLGSAMRVRDWSLLTSALPVDAADTVAAVLAGHDPQLPGASGPRDSTEAFASAWRRRTGAAARVEMAQRLFALSTLTPPSGVPGSARVATADDVHLLAPWRRDFEEAALPAGWPRPGDAVAAIARSLAAGNGQLLWEVGGRPVALAAATAPTSGMSRIGSVWTPPEHRRRGFGTAVTAAASQWALDAGARHVVLFTDLANPISNSIYPKIGYRPVHDAVDLAFESARSADRSAEAQARIAP